jgi:beta-carotene 3-hydroxylase
VDGQGSIKKGMASVSALVNLGIVVSTVVAMELLARYSHEHIMHGWGWGWHKSHHDMERSTFERNDLYALVFSLPSIALIYFGVELEHWMLWVGVGMTIYGFLYFLVHDALVHQRWPFRLVPKGRYLKRLVQAHRLHHAVHGQQGCVSFGFLYAEPVDALKAKLKSLHGGRFDASAAGVRAGDGAELS